MLCPHDFPGKPRKKKKANPFVLSLPPFLHSLLPSLLPPSGALTKETWLSQRPAADLLIHSLCPFYVLLQTYLQRGRGGWLSGKESGKDLGVSKSCATSSLLWRCSAVIKCSSSVGEGSSCRSNAQLHLRRGQKLDQRTSRELGKRRLFLCRKSHPGRKELSEL